MAVRSHTSFEIKFEIKNLAASDSGWLLSGWKRHQDNPGRKNMKTSIPNAPIRLGVFLSGLFAINLTSCAGLASLDLAALQRSDINNFRAPSGASLSTGQPTAAQLEIAARAGVKHVVNLRTAEEEVEFNEGELVESLGMKYYSIPVAGGGGINADNAAALSRILAEIDGEPVIVHCATGNRVGGLMAFSAIAEGSSIGEAMAEGERWGMTSERLKGMIRERLSGN